MNPAAHWRAAGAPAGAGGICIELQNNAEQQQNRQQFAKFSSTAAQRNGNKIAKASGRAANQQHHAVLVALGSRQLQLARLWLPQQAAPIEPPHFCRL